MILKKLEFVLHTQLQNTLLSHIYEIEKLLKKSPAKAVGYDWKIHVCCLLLPFSEVKNTIYSTIYHSSDNSNGYSM